MPDSDDVEVALTAYLLGRGPVFDVVRELFPDYSDDRRQVLVNAVVNRYWDLQLMTGVRVR